MRWVTSTTRFPDDTPQPQAGLYHDRHGHPENLTLSFDPDLVRLHMTQLPRTLYQMLMNLLTVFATARLPGHHGGFV